MKRLIFALLFVGCVPVQPAPPEPIQPQPAACEAQCARELELKCPEWAESCPDDCNKADAELAKRGSPPPDHSCVANSGSCEEMRRCP